MSIQIDPVHVPLQFLSVQQMQDVRAQETIAPESSLPNETLRLSDYRMSQIPDTPRTENSGIQERENQRKNNPYYQFRKREKAKSLETRATSEGNRIVNVILHIVNVTL